MCCARFTDRERSRDAEEAALQRDRVRVDVHEIAERDATVRRLRPPGIGVGARADRVRGQILAATAQQDPRHLPEQFAFGDPRRERGLNRAALCFDQGGGLVEEGALDRSLHLTSLLRHRTGVAEPDPARFERQVGGGPRAVHGDEVARQAYRGLMANKRAVLPGLGIKIVPFLLRLFPRSFILAAVAGLQLRKR